MWWRACAVWRNRVMYYSGALLIALMTGAGPIVHLLYTAGNGLMILISVFGAVAIALGDHECPCHQCPCLFPNYLFQDGTFSKISAVLSLATTILATALIAYQAW